jgi:hypothetical protein
MDKTKAVVTAGVEIQKDQVGAGAHNHPGEVPCQMIEGSFIDRPDVVETTLAAVLQSRLASCAVAHLLSEAVTCAEAVKAAFEALRANTE